MKQNIRLLIKTFKYMEKHLSETVISISKMVIAMTEKFTMECCMEKVNFNNIK
jgi:hypothetical protein